MSNPLPNIVITPNALTHFQHLIEKEELPGMGLRIFLDEPGLPTAQVSIAFCPPGENRGGDLCRQYPDFPLYIDKSSAPYLDEAQIDYQQDDFGGQLAISAPKIRGGKPQASSSIEDKINYILQMEVNPNLASHGGMVSLVEVTDDNTVVLRFGGGCHGCGMADVTLKQGIEQTLKAQLPEITSVVDITDHATGENPYYASQQGE